MNESHWSEIEHLASEALAAFTKHRATCPKYSAKHPCHACGIHFCGCGKLATHSATEVGEHIRPALCDACHVVFEVRLDCRAALESIPPFARALRLYSDEMLKYVPEAKAHGKALVEVVRRRQGAVFRGPSGVGKTTLAAVGLHEMIRRAWQPKATYDVKACARRALFTSELELTRILEKNQEHEISSLVRRAKIASVLVIDDVGQRVTPFSRIISEIMDHRYQRALPTWVTTALTDQQIDAAYGAGVSRRMTQHAHEFVMRGK